ncbi:MAG: DUF4397 domain-containing protein [Streptosporangiaceae bacterium]
MLHRARSCPMRRLLAALFAALAAVAVVAPAAAAQASTASAVTGWLRLANLSPGEPTFDIYLYPVGGSQATLMLKNIGYGTVSAYQRIPAGNYSVAMRKAGSAAGSPPMLSTTILVGAGDAYTLASVGPSSAPRLELLNDMLTSPKGKALVRIIQASARQSRVTVSAGDHVLVSGLAFGSATTYATVAPGRWNLRASGASMTATDRDTWTAGSTYTLVVLDGSGHLELDCLTDGAGSKVQPAGGAPMGFGGTAPRPLPSPAGWLTAMAGGLLIAAGGALWLRRLWLRRTRAMA